LKFVSLNIVGGGIQDLAPVAAYTYAITGAGQGTVTVVTGTFVNGKPTANLVLQRYVFATTVTFPAGLAGSPLRRSLWWRQRQTPWCRHSTSATTFNAGDVLTLVAPAVPDATLANLAWTFMGTMGA
jgi:hypothetical protein